MRLLTTLALVCFATSAFAFDDVEIDSGYKIINPLNNSPYPICLATDELTGNCVSVGDTTVGDIAAAAANSIPAGSLEDGTRLGELALKVHVKTKVKLTTGTGAADDKSDVALIKRGLPLLSAHGKIDNMESLAIQRLLAPPKPVEPDHK